MYRSKLIAAFLLMSLTLGACGTNGDAPGSSDGPVVNTTTSPPTTSTASPTPEPTSTTVGVTTTTLSGPVAVLIGAGDIAVSSGEDAATAAIIARYPDATVFTTGDNAYPDGSEEQFADYYDRAWGTFKDRTRPAIGNHDAHSEGAEPYFAYFGPNAGIPGEGWYSYDLGSWHVIVLNSECGDDGLASCEDQLVWLHDDLAGRTGTCMLAYWHKPLFNAGRHDPEESFADEWMILDEAGVDLVLNGHDHNYQRYAPQDSNGRPTPSGMREFIVGGGGAKLYEQTTDLETLEEFYEGNGVLKLDLFETSYEWLFIPTEGSYHDTGTGSCLER
ncbi:MAG: metallophosphoesterase [Acidimicrobiia bacterium]|nr:metallophosphoesterase [Acidimicrobiia bacterium]